MTDISVFGAGAFGTALAISLARDGRDVSLIARNPEHAQSMAKLGENASRLPGFRFPATLTPTVDSHNPADICLIAIPTQMLPTFLREQADNLAGRMVVACCKGIDLQTGTGPTYLIDKICSGTSSAILSGPSFAVDIAANLPTALTLGCSDDTTELQQRLSTGNLRLYRSNDVIGVELGGALKNVVAIAAGVAIGAGLGESARAAVITRGYAEMLRFSIAAGALPETLSGLSGFGDLVLTCTSEKSRNYSYGLTLGKGEPFAGNKTVEGISTSKAVSNKAKTYGLDLPLTAMINTLIDEKISVSQAIEALLARPLKKE